MVNDRQRQSRRELGAMVELAGSMGPRPRSVKSLKLSVIIIVTAFSFDLPKKIKTLIRRRVFIIIMCKQITMLHASSQIRL